MSRKALGGHVAVVLIGVLICGPVLLERGYVLVGDMTFVPDQPWKPAWLGLDGSVPRAVPADAVVSVISRLVEADLLQKAILLGTLVLAGFGMLRLAAKVPGISGPAAFGGAALYVWNPYVFERLAIGHWGLLVGYAALPWVTAATLDVRRGTGAVLSRAGGRLVLALAAAAIGSPTGGVVAGLVAVALSVDRARARLSAAVIGAVVVVNLPWLAPALLNEAAASDTVGVSAFAAAADTSLGAWGSLLTFGGIWKEAAAPSERDALLLAVAALVVVVLSLATLVRVVRTGPAARAWVPGRLVVVAAVSLLVAGLPATAPGEWLVTELVGAVPGAGLWRDSQKWLMPFVLVTALGFALLLDGIGRWLRRQELPATSSTVALALVPVVLVPSLAWGLSGRFEPVDYPAEWHTVRTLLEREPDSDLRVAVLPWSSYQRLPWNDRRAALDPASRFFPGQVVASEDLTISDELTVRGEDREAALIGRAIADQEPLGPVLADVGVRYLLVEKSAPSAVEVSLPAGTVLHDGEELLLLDLGNEGGFTRSSHRELILAADVLALLGIALGAGLLIRRKPDAEIGYAAPGSSTNGGDAADYR